MAVNRSFQFLRDEDAEVPDEEPKEIQVNDTTVLLIPMMPTIDLVLYGAGTMEGGARSLTAVDTLFRTVAVDDDEYRKLIGVIRELKLRPVEIAELAEGIVEIYTARPTEPS